MPFNVGERNLKLNATGTNVNYIKISASAAMPLPQKYTGIFEEAFVGITINRYQGLSHNRLEHAEATVFKNADSVNTEGSFEFRSSSGGGGFGVDLGFSGKINDEIQVSAALMNLFAGFTWSDKNEFTSGRYSLFSDGVIDIKDDGDASDTVIAVKNYSSDVPVILRLGGRYVIQSDWIATLELSRFVTDPFRIRPTTRLSVGSEYTLKQKFKFRSGMSIGGRNEVFNLAFGFGYTSEKFAIDLGCGSLAGILTGKRYSFGLSMKSFSAVASLYASIALVTACPG